MKKYFKLCIAAMVAALFIGTFVFLYIKSQPKPTLYNIVEAAKGDIRKTTIITGNIEPRNEVSIKPQISGIISELLKEAGQTVAAGEVIAKVKVIPDMGQLSSAESRVRLAGINLQQAKTDYARDKSLYDRHLISDADYDRTRQQLSQAREEAKAAEDALEVVRDGVSRSNANASSTLIRSTVSGVILDVPVKVGNSVILSNTFNDGTTIATVANMSDLIFRGNIDETDVGRLDVGTPIKITIGALGDLQFDASLEYISPKAVANNGANQFEVKAAVKTVGGSKVRSGYSANAEIVLGEAHGVVTVPESVLEFSGDSTFVYLADKASAKVSTPDQTFTRRQVKTGLADGVNIEITAGVKAGDKIRGAIVVAQDK